MEIARAVVGALTTHTIQLVENEVSYASKYKAQLQHLIQVLQHVDGLLHDKEGLNLNATHVKPAMVPLRHLIYRADNVITDCIVRDEYSKSGISGLFRHLILLKTLHDIGKELSNINAELDKQLANLGRFLQLKKDLRADSGSKKSEDEELMSQDFNPNEVVGLEDDINKIRSWIVEEDKFKHYRIAVSGMGGLGKTTVVKKVLSDPMVSSSYATRIWVSVSKNFNKYKILMSILSKLGGKIPESESQLLGEVRNAVLKEKNGCLVVIDDVWSIVDEAWWNNLCANLGVESQRSCVIVTTRNDEVAKIVVRGDEDRIHRLSILGEENSWLLFSQFACPGPGFEGVGKKIAEKCGGLPLSIKTIGSLLAGKTTLREWTEVLDYFHKSTANDGNEQVIERLRLSYNDLEAHLKQCLLCFSVYPEDSKISADHVIHWWLAEGLLQKSNSKKSALELGREYLSALITRCLVEVDERRNYDGRVYTCKIHDMVRNLIKMIAEEEGFCCFNKQGMSMWNEKSYWLCLTTDLMTEKESSSRGKGRIFRHRDDVKDNGKFLSFDKNSKPRAVLLMPGQQINLNKDSGQLLSLRMLDLSGGTIKQDPKLLKNLFDWITALSRLACLNLTGFEGLEELPSSIEKLRNLQLLILSGCSNLKRLDESVAKLRKLIVLHMESCPLLEYLPRNLESLYKLQELIGFKVTVGGAKAKGTCGLWELANLTELRVLHIVISSDNEVDLSKITDQWNKTLSGLKNLKTLGIDAQKFRNGLHILNGICPAETLRELYLRNYHGNKLPDWINSLRLKKLQYLCIEDTQNVAEWIHQPVNWEFLQGLRLKDMKKLNADWTELKKAMPALTYLEVIKCDDLINLPVDEMKDGIWRASRKRT